MAKTMRIKNLKIQMLAGNSLNSFLDLRSEKTTTLAYEHFLFLLRLCRYLSKSSTDSKYQNSVNYSNKQFDYFITESICKYHRLFLSVLFGCISRLQFFHGYKCVFELILPSELWESWVIWKYLGIEQIHKLWL